MDSIIFDLDGTLWDSTDTVLTSWNEGVRSYEGLDKEITKEELKSVMGLQMHQISERFFPELVEEERERLMSICCDIENQWIQTYGGQLYEGLENTLKILSKAYRLFIVSNCQEGYIEAFYAYHKLDKYFEDYENPGRTGLSKGENIKLIIERNGLEAPIYVGDTEGDHKAANHAGIPFVYANYGFGQVTGYHYIINTITELTEVVDQII